MIASAPGVVSRHRVSFRMGSRLASQSCPDVPMQAGHWKQTGRDYPAVFRRSATTATFLLRAPGGRLRLSFGRPTDEPVSGDWDGDGVTDVGVRRPGWKAFVLTARNGSSTQVALGRVRDTGVTGDWDGDGATDVGVWHPATATFTLRTQSTSGAVRLATVQLGASSDLPTTGDWNGDGVSDLAVWSPSTRVYRLRTTPTSTVPSTTTTTGMGLARG